MMRDTQSAAIRRGSGAFLCGVVALVAVAGCSSSDEEAVTVETIVDRDQRDDAPPQTLAIDDDPAIDGQDPDEGEADESAVDDSSTSASGSPGPSTVEPGTTTTTPTTDEPTAPIDETDEETDEETDGDDADEDVASSAGDSEFDRPPETVPTIGGGRTTTDATGTVDRSTRPGVTVSGTELVGLTQQTALSIDECSEVVPCAQQPPPPFGPAFRGDVEIGEYQTGVRVSVGASLDVYFDQTRAHDEMKSICSDLGGVLAIRELDGSQWAGWRYCHDVEY